MIEQYDIVIIGGGVAGAMIAYNLGIKQGSVLLLEAGADRTTHRTNMALSYAASLKKNPRSPFEADQLNYLESPDTPDDYYKYEPNPPQKFKATYIKMGGGSTSHWLGNVPRFLPNDFRMKSVYNRAVDWPIGYHDLEKYYCIAEKQLGVSGNHEDWDNLYGAYRSEPFVMPEIWPAYSDTVLKSKLEGMWVDSKQVKVRVTPQARNSQTYQGRPACSGNSSCLPICPIQAKYDASVHLKLASSHGVEVRYKSVVYQINKDNNNVITGVHYRDWQGVTSEVKAKIVIIAAHAIETAVLLQESGIANSSGCVGRYLMDHPQGYGVGMSREPLYPFRGPPTISGIDSFRDGEFRTKHGAFRISLGNDGWGRWKGENKLDKVVEEATDPSTLLIGRKLRESIHNQVVRLFRFSFSTEMLPLRDNRVTLDATKDPVTGLHYPKIAFSLDDATKYNQQAFIYASSVLEKLFIQLGLNNSEYQLINENKDFSTAFHIMGTTRMGDNPHESVVNKQCRSHDHPNLYIIGASVFPTAGTANPTLTVAALALRLVDELKSIV